MLSKLLDKLGDWNPQLFREIKGRLTVRKVAIVTFFSLIAQGILIFLFWTTLPAVSDEISFYGPYCANFVRRDSRRYCQAIDWTEWWYDIFSHLSWIFLISLVLVGIYLLVEDIAKEKRLGTLNFISLSPQSSQKILLGKLLGVPILLYLVIALALPLHFWSAYQANAVSDLVIWYGLLIAISSLFYSGSLVFAFLGGNHAWLATILGGIFLWPISRIILLVTELRHVAVENLKWLTFPELGDAVLVAYGLLLYRCLFRSYFFWQITNRLFRNPTATILSKKQSYFWVAESQIFVLGFCWYLINSTSKSDFQAGLYFVCSFNLICFLILIACLSPHRQTLQDWARYQHQQKTKALISDLIWGEKSPALLAIAINLVIAAAIWVPWILLSRQEASAKEQYFISLMMTFIIILIYAVLAQINLLKKSKKHVLQTALILICLFFVLPVTFAFVGSNPYNEPFLWLFSPIAFVAVESASTTQIFIAFIAHLSVLGFLSWQLTRKLKKLGASTSKSLIIYNYGVIKMFSQLLDKLGNWNPQLFREIKGRLTRRNVAIATILSLIAQGLMLIAWGESWHNLFRCLSWGFLIILVLGGIYMLLADIAKENRLGTLHFISSSPQSSQKILLGKLLGVPILLYLAIPLSLPLHLWSAYRANLSFHLVLIWYGIFIAISCFFYTLFLAIASLEGIHGFLAICVGAFFLLPLSGFIFLVTEEFYIAIEHLKWFAFPKLGDAVLIAYGLLLYCSFLRSYLFWQIANRFFRNPKATILSKKQSYFWVAEFQIFLLGFCWNLMDTANKSYFQIGFYFVCGINLICFLLVITCLSPQRQTLQEWVRYRHQQANSSKGLIHDLISGEKSPALLAIAINLVITAAIWVPWILLSRQEASAKEQYFISLMMTSIVILIYAVLAQIHLLKKSKKRALQTALILICLFFVLPVTFGLVGSNPYNEPFLWLFSPIAFVAVESASTTQIFIGFIAHLSVLGFLSWQLTRKLKKFGESTSKSLISSQ